jgi:hypothetical protein
MLCDLVVDAEGFAYGLDSSSQLWAMDLAGELRWQVAGLGLEPNLGNGVAVTRDGYVLAWSPTSHEGQVFAASTGELVGRAGMVEPADAKIHHLDLLGMKTLACDPDGTLLAIFEERLLRFGRDGGGVELWPGDRSKVAPLYAACAQRPEKAPQKWDVALRRRALDADEVLGYDWKQFAIEKLPSRPNAFAWTSDARLHVCADSSLLAMIPGREAGLARFERNGKRVYARKLPVDKLVDTKRPSSDGAGNAYVLARHHNPRGGGDYTVVLRLSSDGAQVDEPVRDTRLGGPLALVDADQLAVAPDGTVVLAANHGKMQVVRA